MRMLSSPSSAYTSWRCPSASYSYVLPSSSSRVVLCEPSQNGWFLERPHIQIQTDSCWGLISKGRWSDLMILRMHEANALFTLHNFARMRLGCIHASHYFFLALSLLPSRRSPRRPKAGPPSRSLAKAGALSLAPDNCLRRLTDSRAR